MARAHFQNGIWLNLRESEKGRGNVGVASGNFRYTLHDPQLLSDDLRLSAQTLAVEGKREVHAILWYANSMKTTR